MPCPPTGVGISVWKPQDAIQMMNLHGGNTCAASPQMMTLPSDHLLQLRAANRNGRARKVLMQSSGNTTSSSRLPGVSWNDGVGGAGSTGTHPYRLPSCVMYGYTTSLTDPISHKRSLSSSGPTTNSNRHSRSSTRPKRPQTAGRV
jgi:hypothetical protein